MGQEFTDPFKNCCCVAPNDINRGKDGGTNTVLEFDDVLHSNMAWIQKIQANWKGKVQRMRYLKQRAEHRAKGS